MATLPGELIEAVSYYCDPERCKVLIDAGFDINTQCDSGMTVLMHAVVPDQNGDHNAPESILKLVEFLLESGANPRLVDETGMKASDYAKQFLDPEWKDGFGRALKLNHKDVESMGYIVELLE